VTETTQNQSTEEAATPKTSELLWGLVGLLPSVDVAYPEWVRPKRRGGLTSEEVAAKETNAKQRAAYQAMLEQLPAWVSDVSRLERDATTWEAHYHGIVDTNRRLNTRIVTDRKNALLSRRVALQLAALMAQAKYGEILPTDRVNWEDESAVPVLANKKGTFEVLFGDTPELLVIPTDKRLTTLRLPLDSKGLTVEAVLMLKGFLGLPHEALTERAASTLRKEDPKTTELEELFGLLGPIATMLTMRSMYARDRKPGSGQ
jgi:hypothetical protein